MVGGCDGGSRCVGGGGGSRCGGYGGGFGKYDDSVYKKSDKLVTNLPPADLLGSYLEGSLDDKALNLRKENLILIFFP